MLSVLVHVAARQLPFWQVCLAFAGLLLLISGPSMIIAYMKLRKRNLGPILDANGWAVNARANVIWRAVVLVGAVTARRERVVARHAIVEEAHRGEVSGLMGVHESRGGTNHLRDLCVRVRAVELVLVTL